MKFFARHTFTPGLVFVVLFTLSNSGITAVLHQCSMEKIQSDQSMECCTAPRAIDQAACEVPQGMPSPSITSQFTCHTNTIVGGLAGATALLEKENKTQLLKVDESAGIALRPNIYKPTINPSFSLSYFAPNISPPSVEKCVLNSSFLI